MFHDLDLSRFDLQHQGLEALGQQPHPGDLVNHFESVGDILTNKDGKIDIIAAAMDKDQTKTAELMFKQFVFIKGMLREPVVTQIDGDWVELKHPHTGNPLTYGDVLTDRSGPKFGGHLVHGVGEEFLTLSAEEKRIREEVKQECAEKARAAAGDNPPADLEAMIESGTATFNHPSAFMRELGDYDSKMADFNLLCQATGAAIKKKTNLDLTLDEQYEVTLTHWMYGGGIKTEHLQAARDGDKNYGQLVQKDLSKNPPPEGEEHMQIKAFGNAMKRLGVGPEALGMKIGMVFNENGCSIEATSRALMRRTDGTFAATGKMREIFDTLGDSGLDFEPTLTKGRLDEGSLVRLREEMGRHLKPAEAVGSAIQAAMEKQKEKGSAFDFVRLVKDIAEAHPENTDLQTTLEERAVKYSLRHAQLKAVEMDEEIGQKIALSGHQHEKGIAQQEEVFGKLSGNASDILERLFAMYERRENDDSSAKSHQQLVVLSTLVGEGCWGTTEEKLNDVGKFLEQLKPGEFAQYITARADTEGKLRKKIGYWGGMTEEQAAVELPKFKKGVNSVLELVRKQSGYFAVMDNLGRAFEGYTTAQEKAEEVTDAAQKASLLDKAERGLLYAYTQVHKSVTGIVKSKAMQALRDQLDLKDRDPKKDDSSKPTRQEDFVRGLVSKSVQSLGSRYTRKAIKETAREKATTAHEGVVPVKPGEVMINQNPLNVIMRVLKKQGAEMAGEGAGQFALITRVGAPSPGAGIGL